MGAHRKCKILATTLKFNPNFPPRFLFPNKNFCIGCILGVPPVIITNKIFVKIFLIFLTPPPIFFEVSLGENYWWVSKVHPRPTRIHQKIPVTGSSFDF